QDDALDLIRPDHPLDVRVRTIQLEGKIVILLIRHQDDLTGLPTTLSFFRERDLCHSLATHPTISREVPVQLSPVNVHAWLLL
ncbi:MAG TPA: hypothetical protein PK295_03340, partial [Candidatus Magasanikbacteria bacterium]|nr:hypothetical protein [Candidatus Magasanikbacteria bacterium]